MTQTEREAIINALIIDNNTNQITPAKLRQVLFALNYDINPNASAMTGTNPIFVDPFTADISYIEDVYTWTSGMLTLGLRNYCQFVVLTGETAGVTVASAIDAVAFQCRIKNLTGAPKTIVLADGVTTTDSLIIPNKGVAFIKRISGNVGSEVYSINIIGASSTGGNLQSVTDGAGNNETNNWLIIKQVDAEDSQRTIYGSEGIYFAGGPNRTAEEIVSINADECETPYAAQLPNKSGDQIFAMVSDLGGGGSLGLIQIEDIAGQLFTDLATASAYIRTFTTATITQESFNNGVFYFTVPAGSDFSLSNGFCFSLSGNFVDRLGLITTFSDSAFGNSTGNNILGNCTFGGDCFSLSTGNNILGNCIFGESAFGTSTGNNILGNCIFANNPFDSCLGTNVVKKITLSIASNFFGQSSTGKFIIKEIANVTYPNFFTGSTATIWAPKELRGNVNLITAKANGCTVFYDSIVKTSELINDGDDGISHFISNLDLPSNLILYPTNVASDVAGYVKMVSDIHDADYNTTAVDVTTAAITTTGQLISQRISAAGLIVGNPGIFNITTIGNIRHLSGSGNAEFYFEVYKRTAAGVETLICTSSPSLPVTNGGYSEFSSTGLFNDGTWLLTDRLVIKSYANRIAGGSNPVYQFQFGGMTPVRTMVPIPLSVVPSPTLDGISDVVITTPTDRDHLVYDSTAGLWINKKMMYKNSVPSAAVTGTTAETLCFSQLIPANWNSANDLFNLIARIDRTAFTGSCLVRIRIGTTSTFNTSLPLLAYLNMNTNQYGVIERDFLVYNGNIEGFNSGVSAVSDKTTSNAAKTLTTYNPAANAWIFFSVGNAANGDSSILSFTKISK